MKRKKYESRTGANHGEHRITDDFVKSVFGNDYTVVWNGHSHFVQNILSKQYFYIDKKEKKIIPLYAISAYCDEKKNKQKDTDKNKAGLIKYYNIKVTDFKTYFLAELLEDDDEYHSEVIVESIKRDTFNQAVRDISKMRDEKIKNLSEK